MKPFDPSGSCPKCGGLDIHTRWFEADEYRPSYQSKERAEHLRRYCRRCGYEWHEAPIPAAPSPSPGAETPAEQEASRE